MDSVYIGIEVTGDFMGLHIRTYAFPARNADDWQRAMDWQAERPDRRTVHTTTLTAAAKAA